MYWMRWDHAFDFTILSSPATCCNGWYKLQFAKGVTFHLEGKEIMQMYYQLSHHAILLFQCRFSYPNWHFFFSMQWHLQRMPKWCKSLPFFLLCKLFFCISRSFVGQCSKKTASFILKQGNTNHIALEKKWDFLPWKDNGNINETTKFISCFLPFPWTMKGYIFWYSET